MNTSAIVYPSFREARTYLLALLFMVGNIVLPQLCHIVPGGGPTWLPIYFFTLIGAYAFGWRVGLLTAIASPVVNCVFFGMPALGVLPGILVKSLILAGTAGIISTRTNLNVWRGVLATVVGWLILGTLGEWAITSSSVLALQDLRLGLPGIAAQIILAPVVLKLIRRG